MYIKNDRREFLKKTVLGGIAVSSLPQIFAFGGCHHAQQVFDFAKTENMNTWLRHPVLGDPSFDTFEKLGDTVHQSEPPYEWAVNGSLFCDPKDGAWYLFAGLYPWGYATAERDGKKVHADFKIYKSTDEGKSWLDLSKTLGRPFPYGHLFEGYDVPADRHPDVVMEYDPETKLYWLAYDWGTILGSWETAHHPPNQNGGGGAALAYATNPAGPFTRLTKPIFTNFKISRKLGRFSRAYFTAVFKRKSDWIALTLCDTADYYSWGLVCFTADTPEGEWSEPKVLLSVDRPEYYPAPIEHHPGFVVDNMIYVPATSVALNRNYQGMHVAPLEEAHRPEAWTFSGDGNAWHSRPISDEKYSIWGQNYLGFVDKTNGKFTVMYPSRDERGFGTLSIAQRLWDKLHSDGFTFSGHAGKSVSPLMRAYRNFTLEMEFIFTGTIEIAFDNNGILGPDAPRADSSPSRETLSDYRAVRLSGGKYQLVSVHQSGEETMISGGEYPSGGTNIKLSLIVNDKGVNLTLNGVTKTVQDVSAKGGSLALIAYEFSILTCSKYVVRGEQIPCSLKYQAYDAILGAGQRLSDWKNAAQSGLACISDKALMNAVEPYGAMKIYGKWNVICKKFTVYAPKAPVLGKMRVVVDGAYKATVDLYAENKMASSPVYSCELAKGYHGIAFFPEKGEIVLDVLEIEV